MTVMNAPRRSSSVRCRLLAMGIVGLLATVVGRSPVAAAADLVWVGNDGANTSNFSYSGNWQGNTLPSWGYTNSLKFNQNQNSNVTGLNYDWGEWRLANDISWDSSFPVARTLSASNGGGINFKTRIENNSSFTQTVDMNLSGGSDGASDIQLNPVKGSLTLSGTIFNDNSVDYTVYGSDTGTTTNLTLNTALGWATPTQANVDITVAGGRNTAVQVNASQLWAGTTTVNSGAFTTGNGVTLASTAIVVGGGTVATTSANTFVDTASLTVNTGRLVIGGNDTVASLSGTSGTVELASGATLTFGGSGSTSYAGSITGAGNLTKVGSGTFTLPSASSLTGTMTVEAGSVVLNNPMTASALNVNGGSLAVNLANVLADTAAVTITGGTLSFLSVETIGSLAGTGGTVVLATEPQAFVVNQNVNTNYAGTVNAGRFIKSGTGRLTLSGTVNTAGNAYVEVAAGVVVVDGVCGTVYVSGSAGTLAGTGTMTTQCVIDGVHSPGPGGGGPGIQTCVSVTYGGGTIVNWDLISNTTAGAGTNYDQIAVPTGNFGFFGVGGTTLNLALNGAGSSVDWSNVFWDVNRAWRVWDVVAGSTTGVGNLSVGGSLLDSLGNTLSPTTRGSFSISQDGTDVMLNFVAVPEPSTVCMTVGGLGLATALRYRRRQARDS